MKIIALKGPNSCGKTTTLNLVYDELDKRGATIHSAVKLPVVTKNKDFECIINYGSLQVAIYSMGDYSRLTTAKIKEYELIGVDVLIIATNDRFVKPTILITSFTNHHIITKTIASPKTHSHIISANTIDCNTIILHF